ncbi:MAG: ParB/Srx family N-terminal domain-containing protein, partial [Sphingomonadaceae bacterium]
MSAKFDIRKLAVTSVAITLLKEFSDNPRDHSVAHVDEVAESITAFGMVDPILCDENHVVIAGHATLRACKKLGMTQVPVIILDHLSDDMKRALRIAHNRLTENGQWNLDRLATNFEILTRANIDFNLEVTGYTVGEIDVARMGGKDKVKAAAKLSAVQEDVVALPDPYR